MLLGEGLRLCARWGKRIVRWELTRRSPLASSGSIRARLSAPLADEPAVLAGRVLPS